MQHIEKPSKRRNTLSIISSDGCAATAD